METPGCFFSKIWSEDVDRGLSVCVLVFVCTCVSMRKERGDEGKEREGREERE